MRLLGEKKNKWEQTDESPHVRDEGTYGTL